MLSSVDFSGRPFHFIGIGGIGMSALAYVLLDRELPVSGSDLRASHITERLQSLGAKIFIGQDASNLDHYKPLPVSSQASAVGSVATLVPPATHTALLPQVVCSTAINPTNPEYRAALELGCPIFHRSDILAALIQEYKSIAVAGTHGKTTTSSLISYMLYGANLDPTVIVGGEVKAWQGNARIGHGEYLVAEADESDGSLIKFAPYIGIITNAELDHPDHYSDLEQVVETFQTFANRCKITIGSIDCETVRDRIQPTITYSLNPETNADYTVDQIQYGGDGTIARVWERGQVLGQIKLGILGQHNLSNALAAIAVGRLLGLEFDIIAKAIVPFEGARRRFEHRGDYNNMLFIDDYAHHPSELKVTLAAARLQAAKTNRRVVAIFQPHRYSRTQTFLTEFAESFSDADVVILSDIYSAGEPNPGDISGQTLANLVAKQHSSVHYQPSLPAMGDFLSKVLTPGDLVIFLGAGNLNQIIPDVMAYQQSLEKAAS
ncbi:UDP-N-acetylmuramate--L-alanine ligase [Leptolyngbya sp. AN03gr2]|uniref:UDP-N-acetylmuramate--L-alanine ligase n=1 Tax=unclassified Leptolyngbya TaxID=2650499 RepID=UPI003D31A5B6